MVADCNVFLITFLFILLDILSGVTQAVKNKTLSSVVMREGIYHKLSYVIAIALSALIEYGVLHMELGFTTPLLMPVCVMVCLTEIVSIVENVGQLNPDLANTGIFALLLQNKKGRSNDEQNS